LRAAGLPVGTGHALRALEAVEAVGLERRSDLYWTLHSVLVNRTCYCNILSYRNFSNF
jgi:uncharacterized protein with von Willebrand factor type A (vWA) domain